MEEKEKYIKEFMFIDYFIINRILKENKIEINKLEEYANQFDEYNKKHPNEECDDIWDTIELNNIKNIFSQILDNVYKIENIVFKFDDDYIDQFNNEKDKYYDDCIDLYLANKEKVYKKYDKDTIAPLLDVTYCSKEYCTDVYNDIEAANIENFSKSIEGLKAVFDDLSGSVEDTTNNLNKNCQNIYKDRLTIKEKVLTLNKKTNN